MTTKYQLISQTSGIIRFKKKSYILVKKKQSAEFNWVGRVYGNKRIFFYFGPKAFILFSLLSMKCCKKKICLNLKKKRRYINTCKLALIYT